MLKIAKIKKRDGSLADFKPEKITEVLEKAISDAKIKDGRLAKKLTGQIVKTMESAFGTKLMPRTQDVEDVLLNTLSANKKLTPIADAYTAYKKEHKESIGFRTVHGVRDDIGLSQNAIKVLAKRYLLRNDQGKIIETPARMFQRVAKTVAQAETNYKKSTSKAEKEFYEVLSRLEFLPNSPTLMNAGTDIGQLAACFVLPVEDSIRSIFRAVENMAIIHQTGGGTGFSFSKIRPKYDIVKTTKGKASGPISFMTVFDKTTEVIKQGGKRRGANMGILHVSHPDIVEFINSKTEEGMLKNFNISVAVTEDFMEAVNKNKEFWLINPRTKQKIKMVSAKIIFELLTKAAWDHGDPGIIFIDEINEKNPTPQAGVIESTNPCGEQPLLPYESCNLGSINLSKMVRNSKPDWTKLKKTVRAAVHFLDNVIDVNKFPISEIEEKTKANRKIGLGVMGFADMLVKLKMPYDSEKAIQFAEKLMKFITAEARKKSEELGKERGNFPNFEKSVYAKKHKNMRNATVTTLAPTGSISIFADTTSGIEPFFAITYVREILDHTSMLEVNKLFEEVAQQRGFYTKDLFAKIAKEGSVQKVKGIPGDIKKIFKTALEIKPEWHVKMQAAFQKYTDNAVSKTVNLSEDAKPEDVQKVYLLAHKLKCKGLTVYRYGSKKEQVLYIGKESFRKAEEYAGSCPHRTCEY
ncbi:adenosylcobalamin-dependent ribonucleoside-diphosphate reductase [Candidatus Woesearchaeota archaeon]|nr:adenosylcobalamin-dependent ribonucleoside-diphosphate reductase [Candidatus Woesearchaeota archaeon]MBW3005555.1 adenosylcobalamin-dependent ribonucleoside-diphosphate reductase [Candidatus Woesearchaeota archaeon]